MQVIHGLAAVFAGVDDGSITLDETLLAGDLSYHAEQMAKQRSICFCSLSQRANVLTRDDEDMNRGVRMNVGEGDALLVFVNPG